VAILAAHINVPECVSNSKVSLRASLPRRRKPISTAFGQGDIRWALRDAAQIRPRELPNLTN